MNYFSMFSGIGGFELGIQSAIKSHRAAQQASADSGYVGYHSPTCPTIMMNVAKSRAGLDNTVPTPPVQKFSRVNRVVEHEHAFVIPVEWWSARGKDIKAGKEGVSKRVTKLRCSCGEETERI